MGSLIEQAQALRSAQLSYDHAEPHEELTASDWLETVEGSNWLFGSSHDLTRGMDLTISGRIAVRYIDFLNALSTHLIDKIICDTENLIAQVVIGNIHGQEQSHLASLLAGGDMEVRDIAESLVSPFASERMEEIKKENEDI